MVNTGWWNQSGSIRIIIIFIYQLLFGVKAAETPIKTHITMDGLLQRKQVVATIINLCNYSLESHPVAGAQYDKGYFKDTYSRTLEEKMSWMALIDLKDRLENRSRFPGNTDVMLRNMIANDCGKEALKYLGMTKTEEDAFKWYRASGLSVKASRKHARNLHLGTRAALNQRAVELVKSAAEFETMAGLKPIVPKYHPERIKNMFRNKKVEDPFPYPYITENDVKEMEERLDTMMKNGNTSKLTLRMHDMISERNAVRDHLSFYVINAERLGYEDSMDCMKEQFGEKLSEATLLRGLIIAEKNGLEEHPDLHMLVFYVHQALDEERNRHAIDKAMTDGQLTPEETQGLDSVDSKHIDAVLRATSGTPRKSVIQALKDRNNLLKLCRSLDTTNISDVQLGKGGAPVQRVESFVFNQLGMIHPKFGPVSDKMMMEIMKEASANKNLGAAARMSTEFDALIVSDVFSEAIRNPLTRSLTENFEKLLEKDKNKLIDAANRKSGLGGSAELFLTSVAQTVLNDSGNENLVLYGNLRHQYVADPAVITKNSIKREYAQILQGRTRR